MKTEILDREYNTNTPEAYNTLGDDIVLIPQSPDEAYVARSVIVFVANHTLGSTVCVQDPQWNFNLDSRSKNRELTASLKITRSAGATSVPSVPFELKIGCVGRGIKHTGKILGMVCDTTIATIRGTVHLGSNEGCCGEHVLLVKIEESDIDGEDDHLWPPDGFTHLNVGWIKMVAESAMRSRLERDAERKEN